MCVESRVFYPTISQRSCHVKHSKCNQNVAIRSLFNIQEFQAAFSQLYCTVSKCILHGKSAYSVHSVCSYIAQNVRWIMNVHCTVRKCILHGNSAYSVHTECFYIAQNVRLIMKVLADDIAAILPCTALYVQTKCSLKLHVQYTRVSSCFFTIILYCKQVYFT